MSSAARRLARPGFHAMLLIAALVATVPADAGASRIESLTDRLVGLSVTLPDGTAAVVLPSAGRGDEARALLTVERLQSCLATIDESGLWPVAWLVVQVEEDDFDLVLRLERTEDEEPIDADFVFTVPRRDWAPSDVKRLAREATGRKPPRAGVGHLVIQGFSTRVVDRWSHRPPAVEPREGGLAALLPAGSILRDAAAIELGGDRRLTLAVVLRDARFVPSSCADCTGRRFGHADTGHVELVLADESRIVDRLELTGLLGGDGLPPLVPRYPCSDPPPTDAAAVRALLEREPVTLLALTDLDGDGQPREIELPARSADCAASPRLVVRISDGGAGLEIVSPR